MNTRRHPLERLGRPTIDSLIDSQDSYGMRWGRLDVTPRFLTRATGRLAATITVYPPGTTTTNATLANLNRALWHPLGVTLISVTFGISQAIWGVWPAGGAIAAALAIWSAIVIPRTASTRHGARTITGTVTSTSRIVTRITREGFDELLSIGRRVDLLDAQLAQSTHDGSPDLVRHERDWTAIYETLPTPDQQAPTSAAGRPRD